MRISVMINGLEVFNSDVIMLLHRRELEGLGLGFSLPDGAKVDIEASYFSHEKGEGVLLESYTHIEPKECECCGGCDDEDRNRN